MHVVLLLYFTLMFFFLFAVNFVIFSFRATILLNLILNLSPDFPGGCNDP